MQLSGYQRHLIQEALLDFNEEASVYEDYSGRSMYGKECFGIETGRYVNPITVIIAIVTELIENGENDLVEELGYCRQDNMGLGTITYFPNIEWGIQAPEDEEERLKELENCDT